MALCSSAVRRLSLARLSRFWSGGEGGGREGREWEGERVGRRGEVKIRERGGWGGGGGRGEVKIREGGGGGGGEWEGEGK